MKRIYVFLLTLVLGTFLIGCANEPVDIDVTLYTDLETVYETIIGKTGEALELPIVYSSEETVYVGWKEIKENGELGDTIYNDSSIFTSDVNLMLIEENAEDVFLIEEIPYPEQHTSQMYVYVHGYTGASQYLRIPEMISGKPVKGITQEAFLNSNLIEVYIPNTVQKIEENAFSNSSQLTYVEFYGTDVSLVEEDYIKTVIDEIELNEILEENPTTCTIAQDLNDIKIYDDRCPIIQSEYIETRTIGDDEIDFFNVTLDPTRHLLRYYQTFYEGVFDNCIELQKVKMPIGNVSSFEYIFNHCDKLTTLEFREDHERYVFEDGVVYNPDKTMIEYYLPGNQETAYTIPDTVTDVNPFAFAYNKYLETINIGQNTTTLYHNSFYDLPALKEFNVDPLNTYLKDQDGVLYATVHGTVPQVYILYKYPANKAGDTYILPENTDSIYRFAFVFNTNLSTVEFNDSLRAIHANAFYEATHINEIVCPAGLKTLYLTYLETTQIQTIVITGPDLDFPYIEYLEDSQIFDDLVIYVPDEYYDDYLAILGDYTNNLKRMSEYPVTLTTN